MHDIERLEHERHGHTDISGDRGRDTSGTVVATGSPGVSATATATAAVTFTDVAEDIAMRTAINTLGQLGVFDGTSGAVFASTPADVFQGVSGGGAR